MITNTIQIASLINQMEQISTELIDLLQEVSELHFNQQPATGKWSIAQVVDHLYLSNKSIGKALSLIGTPVDRDPAERINELKSVFLDFTQTYDSPAFILPRNEHYERTHLMDELLRSLQQIHRLMYKGELSESINHPAFGDISKLEILHFVLFHTQRHTRQIKMIQAELNKIKVDLKQ
jgi:uncharacterized damage-inducible protein DinB